MSRPKRINLAGCVYHWKPNESIGGSYKKRIEMDIPAYGAIFKAQRYICGKFVF
jgi:hypothetical protein